MRSGPVPWKASFGFVEAHSIPPWGGFGPFRPVPRFLRCGRIDRRNEARGARGWGGGSGLRGWGLGLVLGLLWTGVAAASLGSNDRALEAIGAKDPGEGGLLLPGGGGQPRSPVPVPPGGGADASRLGGFRPPSGGSDQPGHLEGIPGDPAGAGLPGASGAGGDRQPRAGGPGEGTLRPAVRLERGRSLPVRRGAVRVLRQRGRPSPGGRSGWPGCAPSWRRGGTCRFRLVFCHQPLYDPRKGQEVSGHSMDPRGAAELREVFREGRVTRVFASHVHGWYEGTWGGVPFTVTGGGRGAPLRQGPRPRVLPLPSGGRGGVGGDGAGLPRGGPLTPFAAAIGWHHRSCGSDRSESRRRGRCTATGRGNPSAPFSLVTLSGTWRGMGRRYGELMGDKLRELYRVAGDGDPAGGAAPGSGASEGIGVLPSSPSTPTGSRSSSGAWRRPPVWTCRSICC